MFTICIVYVLMVCVIGMDVLMGGDRCVFKRCVFHYTCDWLWGVVGRVKQESDKQKRLVK